LEHRRSELEDLKQMGWQALGEIDEALGSRGWHLLREDAEPPEGDAWVQVHQTRGVGERMVLRSRLPRFRLVDLTFTGRDDEQVGWVNTLKCLDLSFGINTVGQLVEHTPQQILSLDWPAHEMTSEDSLSNIIELLDYYGLSLRAEPTT
jgi:hypothetical protein